MFLLLVVVFGLSSVGCLSGLLMVVLDDLLFGLSVDLLI